MKLFRKCCGDDQHMLFVIQDWFLTQRFFEPTRGGNVLDLVDKMEVHDLLGSSDHNKLSCQKRL